MIDAVSTLSSVKATLRPSVQSQTSYSGSSSTASRNAFLVSRIRMDNLQNVAIIEVRTRDTGEVVNQYPTEDQIRAIKRAAELEERNIQQAAREMAQQYDVSSSASGASTGTQVEVSTGSVQPVQSTDVDTTVSDSSAAVAAPVESSTPTNGYTQSVVV